MIKSMTGFGRCEKVTQEYKISVEMKGVNHRYLDLSIKMPKKFNYFDFMRGKEVTIREILEEKESTEENLTYFVLALHQTEEKVKISIETSNAKLVKPDVILFYAVEDEDAKGYTLWKNGLGPFGIKLS